MEALDYRRNIKIFLLNLKTGWAKKQKNILSKFLNDVFGQTFSRSVCLKFS